MARQYTIKDLVDAQVDAARFASKHPDLAGFHSSRYRAMARAFGAGDPAGAERIDDTGLRSLERSAIDVLVGLDSPFYGFLEAPRSVRAMHSRFAGPIDAGIRQTNNAVLKLLQAVVIEDHDIPADRTVTDDDLRRYDFDPSTPWPDEFDYF